MKKVSRALKKEIVFMYMLEASVEELCLIYELPKSDVIDVLMEDKSAAAKRRFEISSIPGKARR